MSKAVESIESVESVESRTGGRGWGNVKRESEEKHGKCRKLLGFVTMAVCAMLVAVVPLQTSAGEAAKSKGKSYVKLAPVELKALLERKDFLFVNVHIPDEGEIERTDASIPFDKVDQQVHLFPAKKDAQIVLYCMSGRMSDIAADTLVRMGYTNVSHLEGGMVAWQKAGYPLKDAPPAR